MFQWVKGSLGRSASLQFQDRQVAFALLLLAFGAVVVAGVDHIEVAALDLPSVPGDRLQDLLVDAPLEAVMGLVAEDLDMIYYGKAELSGFSRIGSIQRDRR